MGNHKRSRIAIVKYLHENGPSDTHQIYEFLKSKYQQSPTMNALGNLLAKHPRIEIIGTEQVSRHYRQSSQFTHTIRHRVNVWSLKEVGQ